MSDILNPNTLMADCDLRQLRPDVRCTYICNDDCTQNTVIWEHADAIHTTNIHCTTQHLIDEAAGSVFNNTPKDVRVVDVWDDAEKAWWRFVRPGLRTIEDPNERERIFNRCVESEVGATTGDGMERDRVEGEFSGMTDDELLEYYESFVKPEDEYDNKENNPEPRGA